MVRAQKAAKPRYHHGDLKVALIEAATRIVSEKRVEGFTVADAARAAGVSSGAPYRHFADRDDLLDHVAAAGFERLSDATGHAMAQHPAGSIEGLVAGGCAYIDFSAGNPELTHLMWGATRPTDGACAARAKGDQCSGIFIERFKDVLRAHGLDDMEPHAASAPLWAMVHGFATLLIGVAEKLPRDRAEIHASVDMATRAYFTGLRAMRGLPACEAQAPLG